MAFSRNSDYEPNSKLITHLRSDETTGYHQIVKLIIFYAILVTFYALFALAFSTGVLYPLDEKTIQEDRKDPVGGTYKVTVIRKVNYQRIAIVAILFVSGIISANLLFFLPRLNEDEISYLIFYWVGILIVPIIVLILAIWFRRYRPPSEYNFSAIALAALLAISGLIAVGLGMYLPKVKTESIFYTFSVLSMILAIPVAITIALIATRQKSKAVLLASGTFAAGLLILFILS